MLKTNRSQNVYVMVSVDDEQSAIGEKPTVSIYRTLQSAKAAMSEDIRITKKCYGYHESDIIRNKKYDFAMTKDERFSWSIEFDLLR